MYTIFTLTPNLQEELGSIFRSLEALNKKIIYIYIYIVCGVYIYIYIYTQFHI